MSFLTDFRCSKWVAMAILLLLSFDTSYGQDESGDIEARILFTHGQSGALHGDEFFFKEDPEHLLLIKGLRARAEDRGIGHLSGAIRLRGQDGAIISDFEFTDTRFRELFGAGVQTLSGASIVPGQNLPAGPTILEIEATCVETGQRFKASRTIRWKSADTLTITKYRIRNSSDSRYDVGTLLRAGRDYSLYLEVRNLAITDGKVRCRVTVLGCDESGKPFPGVMNSQDAEIDVGDGSEQSLSTFINCPFQIPRAGVFELGVTVEDLTNSKTTKRNIPITVTSLFDSPKATELTNNSGELRVDLALSQGSHGPVRRDNMYFENETVFFAARVSGLKKSEKGARKMAGRVRLAKTDGTVLYEKEVGPVEFEEFFGGDSREFPFLLETNFVGGVPHELELSLKATDLVSGTSRTAKLPIEFNPDAALHTTAHSITLDEEGLVPAGPVLDAGRIYYLHGKIVGFSWNERAVSLGLSVRGVSATGEELSELVLSSKYETKQSRYGELSTTASFRQIFSPNRPGNFALRVAVTDNHTGAKCADDIPVVVKSFGPNKDTERK